MQNAGLQDGDGNRGVRRVLERGFDGADGDGSGDEAASTMQVGLGVNPAPTVAGEATG